MEIDEPFFSKCVAKGSCFILGLWGWTCVRSTLLLCLRSQPPAVRARWGHCGDPMAVLIATAAKVVTSGGFKRRAMSFRVAGVGVCDIPTCFIACRKSFCVTGIILLRGFQKRTLLFRARRSTLETSMFILRGMRSTLDMSCCVFFCESHCQGCVKW